jgi:hypothetical protein
MYDEATATLGGDVKEPAKKLKKPSRAERIAAWRKENEAAYTKACHESNCTCTPTRAQMLIMNQWASPPVD